MRIRRIHGTEPPTLREHRERRQRALELARLQHPHAEDVRIHSYYAGGFFAEVRDPGATYARVVEVVE